MSRPNPLTAYAETGARHLRLDLARGRDEPLPEVAELLAGASEVDITPPPGLPKAGHSRNARTGTGFRTRLRAHVLHLRTGTASVALIQCDLGAGSPSPPGARRGSRSAPPRSGG